MYTFYKVLIRFKYLQFKELALQKKEEFRSSMSLCAVLATPTFPPACIILKHNVLHAIPVSNSSRKACMQTQACSHCFCGCHRFKLLLFPGYHACFSRERERERGRGESKHPACFIYTYHSSSSSSKQFWYCWFSADLKWGFLHMAVWKYWFCHLLISRLNVHLFFLKNETRRKNTAADTKRKDLKKSRKME